MSAAKQALGKASNKDVKAFAQDMVRDHEAVSKQALDLVKKLNVTPEDIQAVLDWDAKATPSYEIDFTPARVIMQDFTGVPCVVDLAAMREAVQKLGEDESYQLTITESGAQLTAPTALGALHGLQTFLQLVTITPSGFAAPAIAIKDQPRFPWRGLLIDVSRHFIPLDVLKRNLDGMAAVKMNVLH